MFEIGNVVRTREEEIGVVRAMKMGVFGNQILIWLSPIQERWVFEEDVELINSNV